MNTIKKALDSSKNMALAALILVGMGCMSTVSAKVLATVDGQQITEEMFDEIKAQNPSFDFSKLPKDQQKELVDQAINNVLIAKDAQKQKLDTAQDFTQAYERITKSIKDRMLVQAWAQNQAREIASKVSVGDQDVRAYYDSHKADFNKPNVHARHIILKTESEAKKVIDELNKTPKSKLESRFIELANAQTIDPGNKQAQNGGDLGSFTRDQMIKGFSEAAFAMNAGTYSKTPVKTDFGYHVIYIVKKADSYAFDEVKPYIQNMIGNQKVDQEIQNRVNTLRKSAKISISL